jgi:hypothetical protein
MPPKVDPRIRETANKVIAEGGKGRVVKVLKALLEKGSISTDEIKELGYTHPPRAAADVKDLGIPIHSSRSKSASGRLMAVYSFGDPSQIQEGRAKRAVFPKQFKKDLIERYGSIDCITGATLEERVLQIDHRIPFRIAGDEGLEELDVEKFMLLDGSSQRAKSWTCEHCSNMEVKDPAVCKTCFWAYPENYEHIATEPYRRVDVTWQNADVPVFDRAKTEADKLGISVAELIRRILRQRGRAS